MSGCQSLLSSGNDSFQNSSLAGTFSKTVRPLLDAVDKMRSLGICEEGIRLPTIVVVGDQSSGKSSVLESLAGISLPKGKGIVTRVPLVLRLKKEKNKNILVSFKHGREAVEVNIKREEIYDTITKATSLLAGEGKGVKNNPISMTVCHPEAPDLTLVDLPGITRVPVAGQPENIYSLISGMIKEYIAPDESVILNVLSAEVDFPTCESIALSKKADPRGERTLAVVTKVDRAPDGLYEKVTDNVVNVGLGYVCVRNQIDTDKLYEEARKREKVFFQKHSQLSSLHPSMLGVGSLAQRLASIQAERVTKSFPSIRQQIHSTLWERQIELQALPRGVGSVAEAMTMFHGSLNKRRRLMHEILNGQYDQYEDKDMHIAARLDAMFEEFATDVRESSSKFMSKEFRKVCSEAIEESRGVSLPNILSHPVLQELVRKEIKKIVPIAENIVAASRAYAEVVAQRVANDTVEGYPRISRLISSNLTASLDSAEGRCANFVNRIMKKELAIVYTNNHYYMETVMKLQERIQRARTERSKQATAHVAYHVTPPKEDLEIEDLVTNEDQASLQMQINISAYWKVIIKRVCDIIPMEIRYSLGECLLEEVDEAVLAGVSNGTDIEALMEVQPELQMKRLQLERSISVLKEASSTLNDAINSSSPIPSRN